MEQSLQQMMSSFMPSGEVNNLASESLVMEQEDQDQESAQTGVKKDRYKTLMQVVRDHGYPIERHFYTTQDDYINCVFRISGPRGTTAQQNAARREISGSAFEPKPVILYQHGLMDSACGICMDGRDSMAFYFADLGFDVWMNNQRGNRYSKLHRFKEPAIDEDYWDFSFFELGKYDQPALIKYVLQETGAPNLTYIGHSQGTTQMFSALSEDVEFFRERINLFIMLAPVARVDRCLNTTIHSLNIKDDSTFVKMARKMGPELMRSPQVGGKFMSGLVRLTRAAKTGLTMLSDEDPSFVSKAGFNNFLGHFPAGTSFNCGNHYRQCLLARRFQKYDYGPELNLEKYGQETPPEISLRTFQDMPIALFCGSTDKLASPHDYMWLRDELVANQNCVFYREYPFGHMAFLMPAQKDLFHEMFALTKRYNPLYKAVGSLSQEQRQADGLVALNVANMQLSMQASRSAHKRINIIDGFLNQL